MILLHMAPSHTEEGSIAQEEERGEDEESNTTSNVGYNVGSSATRHAGHLQTKGKG